mmetsp:Transcript_46638/g.99577  ORF Transcript_46638/g.99577 Transcript_46638/m.99577 type:complete len:380 (-) Transcript_46638:89-1228(-)
MAGLAPPAVFVQACEVAVKKAQQPILATLVLGVSAGALIGMGALLMTAVGASSPSLLAADVGLDAFLKGAVGLPAGLTLVVLTGAELFTSNIFIMLSGVLQGTVKVRALIRNWALSYFANFMGSLLLVLISYSANTLVAPPQLKAAKAIAVMKVSLPFHVAFAKGILCNWLVCLAVWGALASPSISGKVLAIFWPIATFVALGFEHCVANMFLIPQGVLAGAEVSIFQFILSNIVPVTAGNIVGAAIFVAGIQYLAFGNHSDTFDSASSDEESPCDCVPTTPSKKKPRTRGLLDRPRDVYLQREPVQEMPTPSKLDRPPTNGLEEVAPLQKPVDLQRGSIQQPQANGYQRAMMLEGQPLQPPSWAYQNSQGFQIQSPWR